MRILVLLALGGLIPSPAPQEAPPKLLALRGANLYPGSGPALEHATLLVEGGRISAVGRDLQIPPEATVLELSGKVVVPGLIDAASRLFLEPDDRGAGQAEQNVLDAVDRTSELYVEAVEEGVTAVYLGPPSTGPVNGLGAILRPDRRRTVLVRDAALKLSVGVAPGDTSTPAARYESFVQIRQALDAARQYGEAWAKYRKAEAELAEKKPSAGDPPAAKPQKPKTELRQEVLLRTLAAKDPLLVRLEAHTSDAILLALKLVEEYKLRAVLEGATEAWRVAEAVKKSGLSVVVGPVFHPGSGSVDFLHHSTGCSAALVQSGVPVSIGSFGDEPGGATRFLADAAALASSRGLSREQALGAITIEAAKTLGIAKDHGSLEKGKAADLVVLSGEPFDRRTRVERTMIDGQTVFQRKAE